MTARGLVLDLGCGSHPKGDINIDAFIAPEHRGHEDNDINPKKITNFILADAHCLPLKSNIPIIKKVYCSNLLEHCYHPLDVVREIKRVASNALIHLVIPTGFRYHACDKHLYCWDLTTFANFLKLELDVLQLYPMEPVLSFEKYSFIEIILRFLWRLFSFRTQITAVCKTRTTPQ